jgi:hypothetical protein
MNERVSVEAVQESLDKLVRFSREAPAKLRPRTRKYWFAAALGVLLLAAAVAAWWSWGAGSPTQTPGPR